ncbi:MAG: hypothetical protein IJU28_07630 [Clostridia bacterium]|nr:hypothetical protein [Clostridia bacterium]
MYNTLCVLLALSLVFVLIFAGASGSTPSLAPRAAAWWSLLFPGLFSPDTSVTFTWPLVNDVLRFFHLCG